MGDGPAGRTQQASREPAGKSPPAANHRPGAAFFACHLSLAYRFAPNHAGQSARPALALPGRSPIDSPAEIGPLAPLGNPLVRVRQSRAASRSTEPSRPGDGIQMGQYARRLADICRAAFSGGASCVGTRRLAIRASLSPSRSSLSPSLRPSLAPSRRLSPALASRGIEHDRSPWQRGAPLVIKSLPVGESRRPGRPPDRPVTTAHLASAGPAPISPQP